MKIKDIPLQTILSENAGSCFGVNRALKIVTEQAQEESPLYTFGPLIHNPRVIKELEEKETFSLTTDEIDKLDAGSKLVLRAHGTAPKTEEALKAKKLILVDATCPFVKKAQEAAKNFSEKGFSVVIVGEKGHPEVESLLGYAPGAKVVASVEETEKLATSDAFCEHSVAPSEEEASKEEATLFEPVGLLSQTTQQEEVFEAIKKVFEKAGLTVATENTICQATRNRQESAKELSQKVDAMVVLGGKNSANTTRLAEICRAYCPTLHIEAPEEIEAADTKDFFGKKAEKLQQWGSKGSEKNLGKKPLEPLETIETSEPIEELEEPLTIGITAGASTPREHIEELIERLRKKSN